MPRKYSVPQRTFMLLQIDLWVHSQKYYCNQAAYTAWLLSCSIKRRLNKWLLSDAPTLALRHAAKPGRYRGAGFIYKGIAVTGSSMLYSRILSNCSIGSVHNAKAF